MSGISSNGSTGNSGLRNLDQLRAQHAYAWRDKIGTGNEGGRTVAKKVPAMIIANGFLGALAFALDDNEGPLSVFKAIIDYLHKAKEKANVDFGISASEPEAFMNALCAADADTLRAVTSEAMAYLNYLRRFAKPGKEEANEDHSGNSK